MSERDGRNDRPEESPLSRLPVGASPRPEVEERVVSALRTRGLIRSADVRWRRGLAAAAAGVALLLAGYGLGRRLAAGSGPEADASPRFALFLLRGEERPSDRPEEEAGRVAEYRAWARGLRGGGRFVGGEKLEERAERLGAAPAGAAAPAPQDEIRGFFIVGASSFEEALAIARGCPHLRHGGAILVRPIART